MTRAGLIELNAVVAVATHRSFRKAAVELGVSASALSHSVASLERRMGVRLFNRTTRSVTPSETGEQFLSRVAPALSEITAAITGTHEFRDTPIGTIRLNAAEGAARIVLEPLVIEYLRRYPDMRIDIVTEGRMVDIVADGFDAGIRQTDIVPQDMVAVVCSPPIRFVVVGAPAYFLHHAPPSHPHDLAQHRCIRTRLPNGALYRWEFQLAGETLSITPEGPLTLDNYNLMIAAALDGAGLAWVNEWAVADHIASGRLREVLKPWSAPQPLLSLYFPGHRHIPAGMRAFVALACEIYGASAPLPIANNTLGT